MEHRNRLGDMLTRIDHQKINIAQVTGNKQMSDTHIGLQAGLGEDCVRSMRRSYKKGVTTSRIFAAEKIEKLAHVLQCSSHWLLTGEEGQHQTNVEHHRELADA